MKLFAIVAVCLASGCADLAVSGCAEHRPVHKTIFIDEDFLPLEYSPMKYGIESWERNTNGAFTFTFITVSHNFVSLMGENKVGTNDIYFIRQSATEECPSGLGVMGHTAYTHVNDNESVVCVDADSANSGINNNFPKLGDWSIWAAISAHEVGHVLKLRFPDNPSDHIHSSDPNSIMYAYCNMVLSYDITCVDVRAAADAWGFQVPEKCKL